MDASVEVAAQMEELFDAPLTAPVEVLEGAEAVRDTEETPEDPDVEPDDEPIVAVLTRVGYEVHPTDRAPFKTVSEDGRERERESDRVLTGHSEFTETAEKRARIMSSVGFVTRTTSVYVVEDAPRDAVDGTALIETDEMQDIEDRIDLRDLIMERAEENPA
jgi:putative transcriptional regulator